MPTTVFPKGWRERRNRDDSRVRCSRVVFKVFLYLEQAMQQDEIQRMLDYIADCNRKLEKQSIRPPTLQKENDFLLQSESTKLRAIRLQMQQLWRDLFVHH